MAEDGFNVEGAGHAVHDLGLLTGFKWYELLTLGRPKALRGERTEDSYEAERKMTWSELFFDLIFVTGARRLGDMLRERLLESAEAEEAEEAEAAAGGGGEHGPSGLSLAQYTFLFLALWSLWSDQANYGTRFGVNDAYNFFHFGLFMAGVIGVVCSIGEGSDRTRQLYLGFCFSYAVHALTHLRVLGYFRGARAGRYGALELSVTLFKLGVAAVGYALAEGAYWLAPVVVLGTLNFALFPALIAYHKCGLPPLYIPFHIEHYTERISLLLVIYLGDGVDNLTSVSSEERPPLSRFAFGFLLLLSLKVLLLDACEVEVDRHAIRRSGEATGVFLLAMPCQAFGLGLVSSGLAMSLLSVAEARGHAQWLLAYGTALLLAAFLATALAHAPPNHTAPGRRGAALGRLLSRVHTWQQWLNLGAIGACAALGAARLEALRDPSVMLPLLCAVLATLGAANLLDEFIEGRMDALSEAEAAGGAGPGASGAAHPSHAPPPEQKRQPPPAAGARFDDALAALRAAVADDARLRAKAAAALEELAATPAPPGAASSSAAATGADAALSEPLLRAGGEPQ